LRQPGIFWEKNLYALISLKGRREGIGKRQEAIKGRRTTTFRLWPL
jgi:hypothetical protein